MEQTTDSRAVLTDKTILLVDDETQSRDLLVQFFQIIGCQNVTAVSSGEKAVDYLKSNVPHLILLDYRLPGMSGLSTLREVKRLQPTVPVIMMTAYSTQEVSLKAIEEGALELTLKPLDLRKLEQQVVRVLSG